MKEPRYIASRTWGREWKVWDRQERRIVAVYGELEPRKRAEERAHELNKLEEESNE